MRLALEASREKRDGPNVESISRNEERGKNIAITCCTAALHYVAVGLLSFDIRQMHENVMSRIPWLFVLKSNRFPLASAPSTFPR